MKDHVADCPQVSIIVPVYHVEKYLRCELSLSGLEAFTPLRRSAPGKEESRLSLTRR